MNVPVRAATDLRLLRAAVFSAVCVLLSASGHSLVSGASVPMWSLATGWAGVVCVVGPLAGRERSLPGIALGLLAGETGLHLVFSLGQGSVAPAPADKSAQVVALAQRFLCGAGSAHLTPESAARILRQARIDPARAAHGVPAMAGMAGHGGHAVTLGSTLTPPMLAAHLAAVAATGWVLRRGEAALWQTVRLPAATAGHLARLVLLWTLRALLVTATSILVPLVTLLRRMRRALAVHRPRAAATRRLRSTLLSTCVVLRGPPTVATSA
ncbi:hypothetical protein [Streptomyces cylindrosporus]|uniref:Integral membrane protein n=1 Tax=Streptomyces cylindrosporus TaxID=2927583 RepID=A0ABS9YHJ8_9ACTN|nr:hypothetical protein [Streptomyces cylindrosporus]MCI3276726.1 hypothetical protein [Streptomyces cylindrosporus]